MRMPGALLLVLLTCSPALAAEVKVGDRIHLKGGTDLWDKPGTLMRGKEIARYGTKVVDIAPGGAVFIVRQVSSQNRFIGNTWRMERVDFLRLEDVTGTLAPGWVDHLAVAKPFDISKCATVFKRNPAAIAKCKG